MKTKLTIAILVICLFLVSGCIGDDTTPTGDATAQSTEPELITILAGEISIDSFGNEYTVTAFGFDGVDLSINSRKTYICLHCERFVNFYDAGHPDGVKIYLKAFDKVSRKATIEVIE